MGGGGSKPEKLKDVTGKKYSIPDNATGCYGSACNTPLNKIVDEHISKSTNNFFSDETTNINASNVTTNSVKIDCEGAIEDPKAMMNDKFMEMTADIGTTFGPNGKQGTLTFCDSPAYCGALTAELDAESNQAITIKDITQYSPETAVTDTTNIAAVVSNSTQFMDSSMFGNTQGPKNLQQLSNIDLKGQDITEQNASITKILKEDVNNQTGNKIDLKTDSKGAVMALNIPCQKNVVSLHSIGNQKISTASTLGNSAALSSAQSQGVTVDASNKDETTHHNTNLNDALDTVGGVVNHLADDVNNIIGSDVAGDMETGWIATMILPCVGIAVICIGLGIVIWAMSKHGSTTDAPTDSTTGATTDATMTGGGLIIKNVNNLKLTNEQLIIIIIIILLIYNIRDGN